MSEFTPKPQYQDHIGEGRIEEYTDQDAALLGQAAIRLGSITERELLFVEQSEVFLELVKERYSRFPETIEESLSIDTRPPRPIVVNDLTELSDRHIRHIQEVIESGDYTIIHVVPEQFKLPKEGEPHPMIAFTEQINTRGDLGYSVNHPMEGHPEAISRFGQPDGTLKLYNLVIPENIDKYKEIGETDLMFDAHNDGLGYAGYIRNVIMTVDRPPITGGYTYFQNLVELAPALAETDPEAYQSLFLPDAITAIRPRGKGAIKVTSPVFFVGAENEPQTFFRVTTGEYKILWRDHEALARARAYLERMSKPFAPSSTFVHYMHPGETVIAANQQIVHGRTEFTDPVGKIGRTLARKWFVKQKDYADYRHVPGMAIHENWSHIFPEQFGDDKLNGDWHYDVESDSNKRIS